MKVRELMTMLAGMDADADVVVPGSDHSYQRVSVARAATAESVGRYLGEWDGPEHVRAGAVPVSVVVIV